ncbi:hypothetical protein ACIBG8_02530 [Nonomuraea sp. NPDC050556]|uniref:hypothetical protein n=1 Tax=Nonomuraea sp. NPDC050556 TaxID=3364369 RepID=UPI00378E2E5A
MRRRTLAALVLLAGGLFTGAPSAFASSTAGLSYFDCDTGAALVVCSAAVDGTPPFSIRWTVNGAPQPFFNDSAVLRVGCVVGRPFDVQIAVVDAAGTSATGRERGVCRRIQE